ncbi:hypothetical protein FB107DRAFT_252743 [Schizophyllum commune]
MLVTRDYHHQLLPTFTTPRSSTTWQRLFACHDTHCALLRGDLAHAMDRDLEKSLVSNADVGCDLVLTAPADLAVLLGVLQTPTTIITPKAVMSAHPTRLLAVAVDAAMHLDEDGKHVPSSVELVMRPPNASVRVPSSSVKAAPDLNRPHPSFPPSVIIAVVEATLLSVSSIAATPPRAASYTRLSRLGDRGAMRNAGGNFSSTPNRRRHARVPLRDERDEGGGFIAKAEPPEASVRSLDEGREEGWPPRRNDPTPLHRDFCISRAAGGTRGLPRRVMCRGWGTLPPFAQDYRGLSGVGLTLV